VRDFARKSPTFWTRGTGKKLRGHKDAQILADYLTSSPSHNAIGLYSVGIPNMCHETGLSFDEVLGALQTLEELEFAQYDREEEVVWVRTMVLWQYGLEQGESLKPGGDGVKGDNKIRSITKDLINAPRHPLARSFYDTYAEQLGLGPGPDWLTKLRPFQSHSSALRKGSTLPLPRGDEDPSEGGEGTPSSGDRGPLPGYSNSKSKGNSEARATAAREPDVGGRSEDSPEANRPDPEESAPTESGYDMALRLFSEAFSKRYRRAYILSPAGGVTSDGFVFKRLGQEAQRLGGAERERWLRHWTKAYIADSDEYLVNNAHPPRALEKRLNQYGEPKAAQPTTETRIRSVAKAEPMPAAEHIAKAEAALRGLTAGIGSVAPPKAPELATGEKGVG
jgi:hypothetical protein